MPLRDSDIAGLNDQGYDDEFDYVFEGKAREASTASTVWKARSLPLLARHLLVSLASTCLPARPMPGQMPCLQGETHKRVFEASSIPVPKGLLTNVQDSKLGRCWASDTRFLTFPTPQSCTAMVSGVSLCAAPQTPTPSHCGPHGMLRPSAVSPFTAALLNLPASWRRRRWRRRERRRRGSQQKS